MIQKQNVNINFAQGLDTKTDPWQIAIGKFLALENSVFDKGGQLRKRNGFSELTILPDTSYSYLTTFNNNLTAFSKNIAAFNSSNDTWVQKGNITPLTLNTLPLIKNNLNQTQCDVAVAPNGLSCLVYSEINNSTTAYKFSIQDVATGQNIVAPTAIPAGAGAVTGSPRVWVLGNYFVIIYTNTISAVHHLQYVSIPVNNPSTVSARVDVASVYTPASSVSWDGVVANNTLYLAYNTTSGGQAIKVTYLTPQLVAAGQPPITPVTFASRAATVMSLCADTTSTNLVIYINIYDSGSSTGYSIAVNGHLATVFAPVEIIASGTISNITSAAQNGLCTVFYEVVNNYSYDSSVASRFTNGVIINSSGSITVSNHTVVRSVGLASKAFIVSGTIYFLSAYQSPFQPTYFLINGSDSTQAAPIVSMRLAYENGGGYLGAGLPNVAFYGSSYYFPYLYKDLIAALTNANSAGTSTVGGIYSQTGINLASVLFSTDNFDSAEISANVLFSGGFLWSYDGYVPVENNFFLWPDSVEVTGGSSTGGNIGTGTYFYQVVYEWSDTQGNIYRSAGSIPVSSVISSLTTNVISLAGPYLRLTYKVANPVKVTIYRYSSNQQTWRQITSLTAPKLNDTTADSWTYNDGASDASIAGNSILYTTGGVIEDVGAPATNITTLFDTRFWMVDAEDRNLLWFSKQVIEATPVEMSDLLTFYVAPTTAAQGSTGPITALAPLDDKLIIFKSNAIYYINGTGPDNTGANNQYSQPIFVTSTVGCSNQQSIVFMPQGLMFQSEKGIWLLGRDLSTNYIGAPVEEFNSIRVTSAVNIPDTNQVRFTLQSNVTLIYDYYYSQWGTFSTSATSSCLYQGMHTFLDVYGRIFQETEGSYYDGSTPVLMSFTTGWLNMAGIQGYMRAFAFFLLGKFLSPSKLNMGIAYNYNPSVSQTSLVTPKLYSTPFGSGSSQSPFGEGSPFGGTGQVLGDRVFLAKQRCQSFQISMQEIFDPSQGTLAGAGFTLSGLNLVYGVKKGWRTISQDNTYGGGTNAG